MSLYMNFITWQTHHWHTKWITMPVCHPVCLHVCHPQGKFRICKWFLKLWYFLFPLPLLCLWILLYCSHAFHRHNLLLGSSLSTTTDATSGHVCHSLRSIPSGPPCFCFLSRQLGRVLSSVHESVHWIILLSVASWLHLKSKSWQRPQDGRDTGPAASGI